VLIHEHAETAYAVAVPSKEFQMRAFVVSEFGDTGHVGQKPKPEAGEGELLVRVRAAGVNAMDPIFRAGFAKDFMEHRFPLTPGLDYAGTVEAVGTGVEGFQIDDEVLGAVGKPYAGEGSFAEYATVNATLAAHRPSGLSPEAAAGLPTAGGTALAAIDALDAKAGDKIAVIGAAGGVGGFAVQLGALRGLDVVAVTRPEHAAYVRELGASDVIDYTAATVTEQLRAKAPNGLAGIVDLFHDAQGLLALAPAVRPGGRIASPAAMGIEEAFAGQPVSGHAVRAATDRVAELAELAGLGRLRVDVEVLPLERGAEAIHRQSTRGNRGKLVLAIG
jgi:NADPH:quinone reductase-like Zn-dependent oxidoreductase